jgi:hypothetical protein
LLITLIELRQHAVAESIIDERSIALDKHEDYNPTDFWDDLCDCFENDCLPKTEDTDGDDDDNDGDESDVI